MARTTLIALVAALLPTSWVIAAETGAGEAAELRGITLVVGEQRVLEADQVVSFSESTRGVIEVKVPRDGRRLVITALRPGDTSLLLIERRGGQRTVRITVLARRPEEIETEIRDLVADQPGLQLRRVGGRVFIDGQVADETARERVEQLAALYAGQVASLVRTGPRAVRARPNIRLELVFVELRRSSGHNAGVSWPATVGGTHTLSGGFDFVDGTPSANYEVVDQALPALEAAARAGWARIRKRAALVTTSGSRASYSSGGEINVAVAGSQAAELRTVAYGCRLEVLPRLAPAPGLLDLEVDAEISDLTETAQAVPGRTVSRVQTLVHLGLGQSLVLSGLDAWSQSRSRSGLPGLSRIPILGVLFGTDEGREEQSEGLIVITPAIQPLPAAASEPGPAGAAFDRFEGFDGELAPTPLHLEPAGE